MTAARSLQAPVAAAPVAPSGYPALLAGFAGIAMVLGSWIAVANEPAFGRQVGYLNVAVGGLVVLVAGAGVHLVEFRRQIRRRAAHVTRSADL